MIDTISIGKTAEDLARKYLEARGLSTVKTNYSCKLGEIDLIMEDEEELVFVEVRCRKESVYGNSIETVNLQKQQKIVKTAQRYLQERKIDDTVACRFDVIGIDIQKGKPVFDWIKNAFQVER